MENEDLVSALKECIKALECVEALDLPTTQGSALLKHHGWSFSDRFEQPATKFVSQKVEGALSLANDLLKGET
jgi:hypothetical protein